MDSLRTHGSRDHAHEIVAEERFSRIEEKLLLPNRLRDDFIATANRHHMVPCYPDPTTRFSLIESIYFDSSDFRSFQDHFLKASYRFKLRGRRYAPNGVWPTETDPVYLELKTKSLDISDKVRIKLDCDEFIALSRGELLDRTNKIKTVQKINEVLASSQQLPTCKITYRRFAYEQDQLRITIDDQLSYETLQRLDPNMGLKIKSTAWWPEAITMSQKLSRGDFSLVEVKHIGILPLWLQNYMSQNGLMFESFSKYCFATSNIFQGARV